MKTVDLFLNEVEKLIEKFGLKTNEMPIMDINEYQNKFNSYLSEINNKNTEKKEKRLKKIEYVLNN
jgi:hypothetical protein